MIQNPKLFEEAMQLRRRMFPKPELTKDASCTLLAKLFEEGGELAGATNSYYGRRFRPDIDPGNIEDIKGEIGDVIFTLLGVCEMWETTPDECLEITIEKLEGRRNDEAQRTADSSD